jgi:hypothetical protein
MGGNGNIKAQELSMIGIDFSKGNTAKVTVTEDTPIYPTAKQPALVICSTEGKCLPVLTSSIRAYVPKDVAVLISSKRAITNFPHIENTGRSFGESYNIAVNLAFANGFDSVVVANDDIVLDPTTWGTMLADVARLEAANIKHGWIAARSDWARGRQNIRSRIKMDTALTWLRWPSESTIEASPTIAPIFAYISKEAWVDFPPINWYSDDIQCLDIEDRGYTNLIGSFYVHHVGSQTVGKDAAKLTAEAKAWIAENRPDMLGRLGL